MGDQPSRTGSMWEYVRGHALVRAAIVYGSAVFFLLQILDLLGAPARLIRVLALVFAAGFVVGESFLLWKSRRPEPGIALQRFRRWVLGGRRWVAAAVILLVLGTSSWVVGRRMIPGPVRAGTDVIAVMPFLTSGDGVEDLRLGMVSLISTNLDQVGGIRMIDPGTVLHGWNRRARGGTLTLRDAMQVGRDLGAGAILWGSVAVVGTSVQVTGEIHTVDGERVAQQQKRGVVENLPALIDELSVALLREIWRGNKPVPDLRLAAITTGSPKALRAYLRGERYFRAAQYDSAIEHFEAAVREDSTFALAHFRLSEAQGWNGHWGAPATLRAAEAAIRFSDRLTERERSLTVAHLLLEKGDFAALDSLRDITRRYPDDPLAWYMLGDVLYHARTMIDVPDDEMIAPVRRAIALDPTPVGGMIHILVHSLTEANNRALFDEFIQYYRTAVGPERADGYQQLAHIRWGPADSVLSRALEAAHQQAQGRRLDASGIVEQILLIRFATDMQLDPDALIAALSESSSPYRNKEFFRTFALLDLGRVREASAMADTLVIRRLVFPPAHIMRIMWAALGLYPADSTPAQFALLARDTAWDGGDTRRHYYLARGDLRAAENVKLKPPPSDTAAGPNVNLGIRMSLEARAQFLRGENTQAVNTMRSAIHTAGYQASQGFFLAGGSFMYALALSRTNEWRAEGIRRLRRNLTLNSYGAAVSSYIALAEALEANGDRAGASEAYAHVIRLWKNADPHLQPTVQKARAALVRLSGERPRN